MQKRVGAVFGVAALLIAGAVIAVFAILGGGGHTLRASFDSAVQVVPGQEVRAGGRKVGKVESVEETDGHAVVGLDVEDDDVWPLPRGTSARLRWGSNTGYANRYVELFPPKAGGPALPDGGLLTQTTTPVELDEIFRIFRGRTRGDLGELVDELGDTFGPRARPLSRSLHQAPQGLEPLSDVVAQLGENTIALRTLARSGARTSRALAARDGELRDLLVNVSGTFDELAEHTSAEQRSLERLPATLQTSRGTLARLDGSLGVLDGLVGDLGPGARELRRMARPTRSALAELRRVAPLATSTLRKGVRTARPLRDLLRTGTKFLPPVGSALRQLGPMAACLRPYGPEIVSVLSTWTGFITNYDAEGHYVRAFLQNPPFMVGTLSNSQQEVKGKGGALGYAFPAPPGLNVGQPWFQPQCGAGPEALDPANDPEGAGK